MDVMFFEAFKEEAASIRKILPSGVRAGFTDKTIQAADFQAPSASLCYTDPIGHSAGAV
jgi:hypothetical protein